MSIELNDSRVLELAHRGRRIWCQGWCQRRVFEGSGLAHHLN